METSSSFYSLPYSLPYNPTASYTPYMSEASKLAPASTSINLLPPKEIVSPLSRVFQDNFTIISQPFKPLSPTVEQRPGRRLKLYKYLQQHPLEGCTLSDIIEPSSAKFFEDHHAGNSVIIFGTLKAKVPQGLSRDVVIKVSFKNKPDSKDDNSLYIEQIIYKNVINKLVLDKHTPNVMLYMASFECSINNFETSDGINRKLRNMLNNIYSKTRRSDMFDYKYISYLILEKGKGKVFKQWIEKPKSIHDWKLVLFQLFYTLEVFNMIDLRHNDIHLGNIWIQTKTKGLMVYFIDETTYYVIPKKYLVKIFDFDLGFLSGETNTKLETNFCKPYGICNISNDKFDEFMVMFYLDWIATNTTTEGREDEDDFLTEFVDTFVSPKLLHKNFGYPGRLCNLKLPEICNESDPNYYPLDKHLAPVSDVLRSEFFDEFKYSLPEYDPNYLPTTLRGKGYSDVYFLTDNRDIIFDKLENIIPIKFKV